jgi:hypothetical protein
MSQREANWHTHVAGQRAEEAARNAGIDTDTSSALLDAAAGGKQIGGVMFPPWHGSLSLMLAHLGELRSKLVILRDTTSEMMAIAYCLAEPDLAWSAIRKDDAGKAFEDAVFQFGRQFSVEQLREVMAWLAAQYQVMRGPEPEPEEAPEKKPDPAPETPTAT